MPLQLPTSPSFIPVSDITRYIMMFYGPPGVGKTTFVNGLAPRVFFISTDRGTKGCLTMRHEVSSFSELTAVLMALKRDIKKLKYDIVCFDHIGDIYEIIYRQVCDELGIETVSEESHGKAWDLVKKSFWQTLQRVLMLDVGLVLTSHETIKTVETRTMKIEKTMPLMGKVAWKIIIPKCDLIGYKR